MRILIVEDEKKTGAHLRKGLSEAGFISDLADNGEDGLDAASTIAYELIILDVMLPRRDGLSVSHVCEATGIRRPSSCSPRETRSRIE